jgi:SAM-dependent methyltransferase
MQAAKEFIRMIDDYRRQHGLSFVVRNALPFVLQRAMYYAYESYVGFDRRYGTDTTRMLDVQFLDNPSPNARVATPYGPLSPDRPYGATPRQWLRTWRRFGSRIDWVPCEHREFTFIDIGSGKGRTLLLASDYPFRKIIGVELFPELHAAAERNIEAYRSPDQKCTAFELHCMDATQFQFPEDNLFLQFADPFPAHVLEKVLANLERSLEAHPRKIFISYWSPRPEHIALLSSKPYLRSAHIHDIWSLYKNF